MSSRAQLRAGDVLRAQLAGDVLRAQLAGDVLLAQVIEVIELVSAAVPSMNSAAGEQPRPRSW